MDVTIIVPFYHAHRLKKIYVNICYKNYLLVSKICIEVLTFSDFNFKEFSKIAKIGQHSIPAKKIPAMRYFLEKSQYSEL